MEILLDPVIISISSAVIGYFSRSLWDKYLGYKYDIEKSNREHRIRYLNLQLSEFYWPIYLRLQKDNTVWEKILLRDSDNVELSSMAKEIEKNIILPNHNDISKIIESKIHLANADKLLEEKLLQYLKHIAVYQSIRNVGIFDKDPIYYEEAWPKELFHLIEKRTQKLQDEYNSLIGIL